MEVFGIKLLGINAVTGHKALVSLAFVIAALAASWVVRGLLGRLPDTRHELRAAFWSKQIVSIVTAVLIGVGVFSIWFDDPERLTAAAGLAAGGLAFALQKVVTSLAGYFVILRGQTFSVGDRINMGGVRGDVIAVGFMQTRIMEMGTPPESQKGSEVWVKSRQFTGRVVTVPNSEIFEEPVFNYTRDFPFMWEEITLQVGLGDRADVERILLDAARRHTLKFAELSAEAAERLRARYMLDTVHLQPRVYFRLAGNWIDMTLRFVIGGDHDERGVKDEITRDIVDALEGAKIALLAK